MREIEHRRPLPEIHEKIRFGASALAHALVVRRSSCRLHHRALPTPSSICNKLGDALFSKKRIGARHGYPRARKFSRDRAPYIRKRGRRGAKAPDRGAITKMPHRWLRERAIIPPPAGAQKLFHETFECMHTDEKVAGGKQRVRRTACAIISFELPKKHGASPQSQNYEAIEYSNLENDTHDDTHTYASISQAGAVRE